MVCTNKVVMLLYRLKLDRLIDKKKLNVKTIFVLVGVYENKCMYIFDNYLRVTATVIVNGVYTN